MFKIKAHKYLAIMILSGIGWAISIGPINPFVRTLINQREPQLILVLGGDIDREVLGLRVAKELNLPIVISGGSNPEYSRWLVEKEGLSSTLVKRDYRAKDTLSNFTSLVGDLSNNGISHALLITSEDHLNRAMAIGNIVAGSRGIRLSSISVPCSSFCENESQGKHYIDLIRAIMWVATGQDIKQMIPGDINF